MTQRNLKMIQCRWFTAHAMRGSGCAQSAHAAPPAQCMEKVITPLLMIKSSSFSGTVNTFWHRYSTYHLFIDFFCFLLYCYHSETDSFFFLKDYCRNKEGTFRVYIESNSCGTTNSICSLSLKLVLGVDKSVVCAHLNAALLIQYAHCHAFFHIFHIFSRTN